MPPLNIFITMTAKNVPKLNVKFVIRFLKFIDAICLPQNTFAPIADMLCSYGNIVKIVPYINAITIIVRSTFQTKIILTSANNYFNQ